MYPLAMSFPYSHDFLMLLCIHDNGIPKYPNCSLRWENIKLVFQESSFTLKQGQLTQYETYVRTMQQLDINSKQWYTSKKMPQDGWNKTWYKNVDNIYPDITTATWHVWFVWYASDC